MSLIRYTSQFITSLNEQSLIVADKVINNDSDLMIVPTQGNKHLYIVADNLTELIVNVIIDNDALSYYDYVILSNSPIVGLPNQMSSATVYSISSLVQDPTTYNFEIPVDLTVFNHHVIYCYLGIENTQNEYLLSRPCKFYVIKESYLQLYRGQLGSSKFVSFSQPFYTQEPASYNDEDAVIPQDVWSGNEDYRVLSNSSPKNDGAGNVISCALLDQGYILPYDYTIIYKHVASNHYFFVDSPPTWLTFFSEDNFTLATADQDKHWDGTLEYSTDTENWTVWDGTTTLSSSGGYLYLRGTGNTVITGNNISYRWSLTGRRISCTGNIENLLDYDTVAVGAHPNMAAYCYYYMFLNCTSLISAPALPATTLSSSCYIRMFQGCTSLTTAPALPAMNLSYGCYQGMFQGCTSLTTAPALPAMNLSYGCYSSMFQGCTSLTTAPALPATTLTQSCYSSMFQGCTSLTTAPALPAMNLSHGCYQSMFQGCTSLTTAPALPATTLSSSCYYSMFNLCSSLKFSSTQTQEYSYAYRIPSSGTGITASYALYSMFDNTGGTFTGTPSINTTYYTTNIPVY